MRIIASIGPRDLPAITRLTWVEDVRASRKVREPLVNWLVEIWSDCDRASRAARVGVVNLDRMRADVGREVAEICGELCEMADATQALAELRLRKSACERALLRRSYEILQGALEQIRRQLQSGMAIAEAMIAGERRARRDGAQDVRLLCGSGDRGSLRPVHDAVGLAPAAAWTVYIAVRYCGYWTEAASVLASGMSPAAQAVHATLARAADMVRPGASGGELIEVVAAELADYKPHPMLGRRLGRAQGLSLDEEHWISPDSGDVVVEDGVYTIMAGVGDARRGYFLGSVTVIVGREYNEVMWPVPPANSKG
jgi:Xaa-Pro aminopeptidase